jgi:flavodoxin
MNKLTIIVASILMFFGATACGQNTDKAMNENKTLIAWFSWSGNTEAVVRHIAGKIGADTFRIERTEAYPTDYNECADAAKKEVDGKVYPAIKGLPNNFEQYKNIIVAVPVWWYTAPMPVFTFLEKSGLDFSGKTVIPLCTAYTAEYNTLQDIAKVTPDSEHRDGICIVTKEMNAKGIEKSFAKVDSWLAEIGF